MPKRCAVWLMASWCGQQVAEYPLPAYECGLELQAGALHLYPLSLALAPDTGWDGVFATLSTAYDWQSLLGLGAPVRVHLVVYSHRERWHWRVLALYRARASTDWLPIHPIPEVGLPTLPVFQTAKPYPLTNWARALRQMPSRLYEPHTPIRAIRVLPEGWTYGLDTLLIETDAHPHTP